VDFVDFDFYTDPIPSHYIHAFAPQFRRIDFALYTLPDFVSK